MKTVPPAFLAQVRLLEARTIPLHRQAALLDIKTSTYIGRRYRLVRTGMIPARGKRPGADWTEADHSRLRDLIDCGYSYDEIAAELGRPRGAVITKAKRLRYRICTSTATYSAQDVARLLGKGCVKSITYLIKEGSLVGRNAGTGGARPLYRIQHHALLEFLELRPRWMAWDAERITDPDLRAWAQEMRAAAGGRWLTPGEVARQLHVCRDTPHQWISKGLLPATRFGNWWIWSGDLEGFVIPSNRPRRRI